MPFYLTVVRERASQICKFQAESVLKVVETTSVSVHEIYSCFHLTLLIRLVP